MTFDSLDLPDTMTQYERPGFIYVVHLDSFHVIVVLPISGILFKTFFVQK